MSAIPADVQKIIRGYLLVFAALMAFTVLTVTASRFRALSLSAGAVLVIYAGRFRSKTKWWL